MAPCLQSFVLQLPNKMLEKLGHPASTAMSALNQGVTGAPQSATVKRRKKSTAQPDKKKLFEEAQAVRRVKAYLARLRVTTDEEELMRKSHECEPPTHAPVAPVQSAPSSAPTQVSSAPQQRRRHHSPTPSTSSSTSSEGKKTHARFGTRDGLLLPFRLSTNLHVPLGAASPTSERKMLSLAEVTTKRHRPSPTPSPGALRRTAAAATQNATPKDSLPVDLSVESSSVTSLSNVRKSGHYNGINILNSR